MPMTDWTCPWEKHCPGALGPSLGSSAVGATLEFCVSECRSSERPPAVAVVAAAPVAIAVLGPPPVVVDVFVTTWLEVGADSGDAVVAPVLTAAVDTTVGAAGAWTTGAGAGERVRPAVTPKAIAPATMASASHGTGFFGATGGSENAADRATPAEPGGGAIPAAAEGAKGSGTTMGSISPACGGDDARPLSAGDSSSLSAVATRDMNGTTLLRAEAERGEEGGRAARGAMPPEPPDAGRVDVVVRGGGGVLERPPGGGGVSELRPEAAASRTMAATSGNERAGRHSSRPSCQTSESSVTAPRAAFRRTSDIRIGPTGTPLMATYQPSPGESSDMSKGAETSSSRCTVVLKAPARAPAPRSAFGGGGLAAARPVASGAALAGGAAFGGGLGGGALGAPWAGAGGANSTLTLDSVTAARTSIRCPHLRHFMRTVLPTTFSSAIWYLALHCSHRNFTRTSPSVDSR